MVRTNQGGSILGFIIIGGVLALLLIGGAYFVRHSLTPAEPESDMISQQTTDEDTGGQPSEDEADESQSQDGQGSEDEPAEQPADDDDSEPAADESLPAAGSEGDGEIPGSLPETGSASGFIAALMLGGLAALAVAYKRSRQLPSSL